MIDFYTKLINCFAHITCWCTGNDGENELVRTTASFVYHDDDSSANDTQCCTSITEMRATPKVRPMTGSTTQHIPEHLIDTDNIPALRKAVQKQEKIVWISTQSSRLNVRGETYLYDKEKVPSPSSLYQLVNLDAVHSNAIYLDLGEKYNLNQFMKKGQGTTLPTTTTTTTANTATNNGKSIDGNSNTTKGASSSKPPSKKPTKNFFKRQQHRQPVHYDTPKNDSGKTWNAPTYLIISFLLPTSSPKIAKKTDENGYIVTAYYEMREETKDILKIISDPKYTNDEYHQNQQLANLSNKDSNQKQRINAVKLWEKWCTKAPNDPEMQKRLKFLPHLNNLKDIGVASWIDKYNGKPMLIKRPGVTNFVFSHYNDDRMEIDVNMHPLPYVFKQVTSHIYETKIQELIMTFAFTIEGRDDNELPEVLLGNPFVLPFIEKDKVIKANNIFAS